MGSTEKRILHVEDDELIQAHVNILLDGLYDLVQVSTLGEADRLLCAEVFDLILLDFTLPDGSGQGLLKRVNSLKPVPPVIVLSAHELTKDIPGVVKVLTKGRYQDNDFIKLIKSIVDK